MSKQHNSLHWTAGLHHDGSARYVSNGQPQSGETVKVRLRVPAGAPVSEVILCSEPDGENHDEPMHKVAEDGVCALWEADLAITMPNNPYSFVIKTKNREEYYYNALGVSRVPWPNLFSFKLLADFMSPSWLSDAVFYQIFPDSFCNGDPALNVPDGAITRYNRFWSKTLAWDTPPRPYMESGGLYFYSGDLPGIMSKLDYLQDLGVNALYLNPIFSSSTAHRYNIEDFYAVDAYLGGNGALAELRRALDQRGMRLILDITPNHSGVDHPWFQAAYADVNAPTGEFYTFYNHPHDYARWLNSHSLAKLNYASESLRDVMYRAPDAVMRYWLKPPYSIDGWRLDVFNMTARQGMFQGQTEVMREMRAAVKAENPDAYFMGESFYDATYALQGDQLDAVMNYSGFALPLWNWLRGSGEMDGSPLFGAEDFAEQARRFLAAIPWQIATMQFNLLGSHDTPRIRHTTGGDVRLVRLAVALLMTFPGVPCIYYGDEIGLDGNGDPYNRGPMPWDESQWDIELREWFRQLIRLRQSSPALKQGGYQLLYASGGLLAYHRASAEQRVIVVAYRGPGRLAETSIPVWQGGIPDGTILDDGLSELSLRVHQGHITLSELQAGTVFILEAAG